MSKITITAHVAGDIDKVWDCWNAPEHIKEWAHASDDWECTSAQNDLREGGTFSNALSAKDKSVGFDFAGTYTKVEDKSRIEYVMADGRTVQISFVSENDGVTITETFDPESENSEELQRQGWQAFLDNFKQHCESH